MTRDEFIAKIENPDDVNRVMARVDEGAKLLGKTTIEELEKWYDECAGYYDAAHEEVITKYEQVGVEFNPMYGEEREVLKPVDKAKWFSFLHFNAMISEAMDRYRYMMYNVKLEDSITGEVGEAKMSLNAKSRGFKICISRMPLSFARRIILSLKGPKNIDGNNDTKSTRIILSLPASKLPYGHLRLRFP